jgi:sensor histidine kinase YesM
MFNTPFPFSGRGLFYGSISFVDEKPHYSDITGVGICRERRMVKFGSMQALPFIFSNQWKYRLQRHTAFWVAWWLFAGIIYSIGPILTTVPYWLNLLRTLAESAAYLPLHCFLAYSIIYFIIPRFLLKGKYVVAVISVIAAFFITALMSILLAYTVILEVRSWFVVVPLEWIQLSGSKFMHGLMAGLRGGITVGGMAAAIKLMKHYYVKEQRNLQLQKEKSDVQLQLLKAQVHPHFLFNTLNNIYSHTQGKAPIASQLVMGLSDMLRFMLYEGDQAMVPLSRELKMVQDYINLEKIRYDDRLDVHIDLPADCDNLYITPMLLLPLVENCFKHGTSHMLEQPWLSLHVRLERDTMHMKLINGKPPDAISQPMEHAGIGIRNVRTRLELLYPGKHLLTITDDPDVYVVNLQIQLERKVVASKKDMSSYILSTHE